MNSLSQKTTINKTIKRLPISGMTSFEVTPNTSLLGNAIHSSQDIVFLMLYKYLRQWLGHQKLQNSSCPSTPMLTVHQPLFYPGTFPNPDIGAAYNELHHLHTIR